jgi:predicted nucleotidyltransferase
VLSECEHDCLRRYVEQLVHRLGDELAEVWVFGSVARSESWPAGMPLRSDVDLLVLMREAVSDATCAELWDATYPLFLECGRQISPVFRTRSTLAELANAIRTEAVRVYPPP